MLADSEQQKRRRVEFFVEQTDAGLKGGFLLPYDNGAPHSPDPCDDMRPPNPSCRWLSPLEWRVVRLLCGAGWLSREEIAQRLELAPEGALAGVLTQLVARGFLESSPRKGYALALPADAEPERYRRDMNAWLDAHGDPVNRPPDPANRIN